MINKKDMIIMYLFILIEILLLINSKQIAIEVISACKTFFIYIFPYLFPNMVVTNILAECPVYKIIPNFVRKRIKNNNYMLNIFILSMFCGTPTNSSIIKKYLDRGIITEKDAEKLLCTTHFINPLFIIGSVGIGIFGSIKIGIILCIMQLTSNIIKLYILKDNIKVMTNVKYDNNKNNTFIDSIKTSINNIITILGIVIIFNILIFLLTNILNTNIYTSILIKCLLEITSGIQSLRILNINIFVKILLAHYALSFGGLCIHMQTFSMFNKEKKISYLKYLIFRII